MTRRRRSRSHEVERLDHGPFAQGSARLAHQLLALGIDGRGAFHSAGQTARDTLAAHPDRGDAVAAIIASHRKLIAAGGFVTGLGGLITMPAALPANLVEFYVLATRMVASIAAVRGYDLSNPSLRTAVLLTLVDADARAVMRKAGVVSTGRLASLAASQLPAPVLMVVNKAVGFRLIAQLGHGAFARLGRGVPLAGGVVGAGLDVYLLHQIARNARREFPPRRR